MYQYRVFQLCLFFEVRCLYNFFYNYTEDRKSLGHFLVFLGEKFSIIVTNCHVTYL